jgi:MFS family permease
MTPTSSRSDTLPRAWLVVGVLWVVAALNYLDRLMITTMHDSVIAAIPMTETQFSWLTNAFLISYGVLSPFGGFLADRFNRSRLIIWSLFFWSLFTWLTGYATTYWQLVTVRALMGVSEAAYIPAALALIADYHRGSTRSLATGIHMTGISVGSGLGGVGGVIADKYGWNVAFEVFGIFGVAYTFLLLFTLKDVSRGEAESAVATEAQRPRMGEALADLLRSRPFLLLMAFWGMLGIVGWGLAGWLPVYFKETFKLGQGAAGMSATAYLYSASIVGKLVAGTFADAWSRTNERARILVPVIGLCLAAPGIWLVTGPGILWIAIAGLILYGLTRTFADTNLMPILCQVVDPRYRATGYGVLNMFAVFAGAIANYSGGRLRDAGISVGILFQCSAVGLIVCAGILFMVKPKSQVSLSKD